MRFNNQGFRVRDDAEPQAPHFADADTAEQWRHRCDAALRCQTVRYAVAPACVVPTQRGVLQGGDEITLADVESASRMAALVSRGIVLEATETSLAAARSDIQWETINGQFIAVGNNSGAQASVSADAVVWSTNAIGITFVQHFAA